jgi:hypothetical protein
VAGLVVDLGPVPVMFAAGGAILFGFSLLGAAWGVAGRMTYAAVEVEA